jgi:putative ATP-binding cassette transporter
MSDATQSMNAAPMSKRAILRHAARLLADLLRPASGRRARLYFLVIATLLVAVNGFNVLISYSGRHFMTAIEQRQMDEFLYQALMMVMFFGCSAIVAAFIRFCEERLGLLWRVWLTQKTLAQYLSNRTYQYIELTRTVQHPDQRIAEDIRALTTSALSFILMMLNSLLAIVAFAGVLWSISPTLFLVSVGYALTGSLVTMWMGHRLIELNSRQVDREADMRSDLLHVGSHTEPIALIGEETHFLERLRLRLDKVARNTRRIIAVNRNLTFFSGSYNYLIQIIPALVVAPYFINGNAEFGVIGQSALAFTILVNAFSLIVSQYPALSSFAAVITRLNALEEANKNAITHFRHSFEVVPDNSRVAWENVTLLARRDEPPLLQSMTVSIPAGKRVLITAANKNALIRLFNTTAGIEDHSEGKFYRPDLDSLFFLPERPYLAPGSLHDAMVPQGLRAVVDDKQIMTLLGRMGIAFVVDNAGGLQQEHADWNALLSIGEQKMIGIARMLLSAPRFAFLLRLNSVLTDERILLVMQLLKESKITYINMGKSEHLDCYDAVLEVLADGSWYWQELRINPEYGACESSPDDVPPAAPEGLRADPPLPV